MELPNDGLTTEELNYIAGFFDGEGCAGICKQKKKSGYTSNAIYASVANSEVKVLNWLQQHFGGSVTVSKGPKPNHKDKCAWVIWSSLAGKFLYMIQPYLRMKDERVEVVLEFQRSQRAGIRPGQNRHSARYTTDEISHRDFLMEKIHELNHRGKVETPI